MASLRTRHRWTVLGLAVAFAAMVGLVASSVQIYNLVCRVTGMGGTTRTATEAQAYRRRRAHPPRSRGRAAASHR